MDSLLKEIANQDEKNVLKVLKRVDTKILVELTSDRTDPLAIINPENGVVYLFILLARMRSQNNANIIHHLMQFSLNFKISTGSIIQVNQELHELIQLVQTRMPPDAACTLIVNIASRWADREQVPLTLASDLAVRLCLESKRYQLATKLLDLPITFLSEEYAVDASNFLFYYYYGGMIYLGLKQYDRAVEFFSVTLYVPGTVVSQVQIEAVKKLHLISLINNIPNVLPKQLSVAMQKAVATSTTPYSAFADAFKSGHAERLQHAFTEHSQTFALDGNLGLAKQCLDGFVSWRIIQLTKTYITLSLTDIERQIGSTTFIQQLSIQQKLVKMIKNGQINAKIDAKQGIVRFIVQHHTLPQNDLDNQLQMIMKLGNQVVQFDKQVGKSKQYLSSNKNDFQMMSEADEMFN
ncbi:hypothetical protein HDV01_006237 [Terramyces sp. JEL0728]|nr:hypothetical protein HDV01_006237 [Terramyces sp. JEL0728]